jgi:hypothetical protein
MNQRNMMGRLANALADEGKMDSARRVLDLAIEMMPEFQAPYDYFMVPIAEGYYKTGDSIKANIIVEKLNTNKAAELKYFFSFPDPDLMNMDVSIQESLITLNQVAEMTRRHNQPRYQKEAENALGEYYNKFVEKVYNKR